MNLAILGLIFDIVGVFLLAVISIINPHYWKREDLKFRQKRYSWHAWRPIYRDTKTLKLEINLKRMKIIDGFIPPKRKVELIGLIFIFIGFLLQLAYYFV
ncbi:MAG: hypothetical protein M1416_00190 [Candidatus Pacearchaeota archaeon]|nr:hypothetical protein [Candidatus Pacearchaeota archaeon]